MSLAQSDQLQNAAAIVEVCFESSRFWLESLHNKGPERCLCIRWVNLYGNPIWIEYEITKTTKALRMIELQWI